MDTARDADGFKPAPWPRRLAPWAAGILVLGFVAALFVSPYVALGAFKLAAARGDEARIEQLADIPALRASLKAQLAAAFPGRKAEGFEAAVLTSDSFIDALLTPHNLIALIGGAGIDPNPPQPEVLPPAQSGPPSAVDTPPAPADPVVITGGYAGLNRFEVFVGRRGEGRPMVFSFRRKGLFGWVLTDIRLSQAILQRVTHG